MVKSSPTVTALSSSPYPRPASVVMVKISPHVPSPLLCLAPVPVVPCLDGPLIHITHVVPVIPGCKLRAVSKEALAEFISHLVTCYILAPYWSCHFKYSPSPPIIVTTICDLEGGILNGDLVVGSIQTFMVINTQQRQSTSTWLVPFERVAVAA